MIFLIVYLRIRHARRWRSGASLRLRRYKKNAPSGAFFYIMAETKGFEPLIPLRVYYISNVAH